MYVTYNFQPYTDGRMVCHICYLSGGEGVVLNRLRCPADVQYSTVGVFVKLLSSFP